MLLLRGDWVSIWPQEKVVILHLDFKERVIGLAVIMLCHGYLLCSMKINTDPLFLLYLGNAAVLGWFAGLLVSAVTPHADSFWDRSMPCASLHSTQVSGSDLSAK